MKLLKLLIIFVISFFINGCLKRENAKPKIKVTTVSEHSNRNYIPQQPRIISQSRNNEARYARTIRVIPRDISPSPQNNNIVVQQPLAQEPPRHMTRRFDFNQVYSPILGGYYSNNYKLRKFIDDMVKKYGFRREYLYGLFSTVNRDVRALKKYNVIGKPKKSKKPRDSIGSWDRYPKFVTADRIKNGVEFWRQNRYWLDKAYKIFGVPPEYIVGIIGVETNYGRHTGDHRVLDALTSLALEYKNRSKFFTNQLENYILLTKEQGLNPFNIYGSYGGAFGIVQFMPDSYRKYAIDFDGDGIANLFNPADAIGSVANFFINKGKWIPGLPVAMRVYYPRKRFNALPTGYKTEYSQDYLMSLGMRPTGNFNGYRGPVSLIKLSKYDRDELWWGTKNFYAIARYNPRDYYVMSVHLLGQAVKRAYLGR